MKIWGIEDFTRYLALGKDRAEGCYYPASNFLERILGALHVRMPLPWSPHSCGFPQETEQDKGKKLGPWTFHDRVQKRLGGLPRFVFGERMVWSWGVDTPEDEEVWDLKCELSGLSLAPSGIAPPFPHGLLLWTRCGHEKRGWPLDPNLSSTITLRFFSHLEQWLLLLNLMLPRRALVFSYYYYYYYLLISGVQSNIMIRHLHPTQSDNPTKSTTHLTLYVAILIPSIYSLC